MHHPVGKVKTRDKIGQLLVTFSEVGERQEMEK